jgi:hypothetical protein
MGDLIDGIVRQDVRRFTGNVTTSELNDMLDSALNQQRRMVVDLFSPLADEKRILGALEGNHEYDMAIELENSIENRGLKTAVGH